METDKYSKEKTYLKAKKKVEAIKGFYWHFAVYIFVNFFITAFKIFNNMENGESFSDSLFDIGMFFVWVPWGIGLLIHGLVVFEAFSFILGNNWEDRKIKELMEKDKEDYNSL